MSYQTESADNDSAHDGRIDRIDTMSDRRDSEEASFDVGELSVEYFDLPANWAEHGGRESRKRTDYYAVRVRFEPRAIRSGPIRPGSEFFYAGMLKVLYVEPVSRRIAFESYEAVRHERTGSVLPSCLWGTGMESFHTVIQPGPISTIEDRRAGDRLLGLANRLYGVETALDMEADR